MRPLPLRDVSPRPTLRHPPTLGDRALDAVEAAVPILAWALLSVIVGVLLLLSSTAGPP